jgi:hypothetical protein
VDARLTSLARKKNVAKPEEVKNLVKKVMAQKGAVLPIMTKMTIITENLFFCPSM